MTDPIFALIATRAIARAALDAVSLDDTLSDDAIGEICVSERVATYAVLSTRPTTPAGLAAFSEFGLALFREVQADSEAEDGLHDRALGRAARTTDDRSAEELFLTTLAEASRNLFVTSTSAIAKWRAAQAAVEAAEGKDDQPDEEFNDLVDAADDALRAALETPPASGAELREFARFGRDVSTLIEGRLSSSLGGYYPFPKDDRRTAAEVYFATLERAQIGGAP